MAADKDIHRMTLQELREYVAEAHRPVADAEVEAATRELRAEVEAAVRSAVTQVLTDPNADFSRPLLERLTDAITVAVTRTATPAPSGEARHVSTRCPRIAEHMRIEIIDRRPVRPLPEPCEQCYSVESVVIPYESPGTKPLRPAPSGEAAEPTPEGAGLCGHGRPADECDGTFTPPIPTAGSKVDTAPEAYQPPSRDEQRRLDNLPCPHCAGDRLRPNFTGDNGVCHAGGRPYGAAPDESVSPGRHKPMEVRDEDGEVVEVICPACSDEVSEHWDNEDGSVVIGAGVLWTACPHWTADAAPESGDGR
jgi:hypothetical protein